MSEAVLCPRCKVHRFTPYGVKGDAPREAPRPAMSRAVDIYICSWCGTHEAFQDLAGIPLPLPDLWPVVLPEVVESVLS